MSVEEARGQVNGAINDLAYRNADLWLAERAHDAIDHLILEVQAEMPCYWECESQVAGTELATTRRDEVLWCPSCTARAKIREAVPHEA